MFKVQAVGREEREAIADLYDEMRKRMKFKVRLKHGKQFERLAKHWRSDASLTVADREAAIRLIDTYLDKMEFTPEAYENMMLLRSNIS